ncbi:MAG: aldehyde dehydrogenase family protein [Gammaproteobacteria bacterium]|nr:aldehyde dehydrogenase family protein [Gammaproteobacteria bacterium]NND36991.1 aldehyde dehydrogenase family protein [Gammaproteobacteria bacterium]
MSGNKINVRNPRTGEFDFEFERPTTEQIDATCERLRSNQRAWRELGIHGRLAALGKLAASLERHRAELDAALTTDTGRAVLANLEISYLPTMLERIALQADDFTEITEPVPSQTVPIMGREQLVPLGLVLCISPWNFPIILSFIDAVPALAAGNAVVVKPSEVTPRWVEPMRKAVAEVPEIAGVLDLVLGDGVTGAELISRADAVAFTGSVRTGRKVAVAAAENFIPSFLELGGNDPAIVLDSADVGYAANAIMCSALSANGQACQSLERAYVARSVYDEFIAKLVAEAERWEINYPDINSGTIGPFIFADQPDVVAAHLRDAVDKGATILSGGEVIDHGGRWMCPTVVTDVTHDMAIMREETFGPVIAVMPFDTPEEAIRLANDNDYGLAGAVFAGTTDEARAVARYVNAGAVSINDAHLTAFVHDLPHQSFGLSGLGPSRFGIEGLTRYARKKALLENDSGQALLPATTIFAESA